MGAVSGKTPQDRRGAAGTEAEGEPEAGTEIDPASVEFHTVRDGDRADIVLVIQQRLMELGYMDSDEPTSYFGSLTKHALKTFQRHHGLGDDGVCGEETDLRAPDE